MIIDAFWDSKDCEIVKIFKIKEQCYWFLASYFYNYNASTKYVNWDIKRSWCFELLLKEISTPEINCYICK